MHYCVAVITEQFPTNEILSEKLKPVNEETFYEKFGDNEEIPKDLYPPIMWDWWQVGGRYHAMLKLKVDKENKEYEWRYYTKEPRSGRLFRSMLFERYFNPYDREGNRLFRDREEDIYGYCGYDDGYLRVDGCRVRDIIDFEETIINKSWGFIGKDGTAYAREFWNGKIFFKDEKYEEKVRSAITDIDDCYVCYVDIHD